MLTQVQRALCVQNIVKKYNLSEEDFEALLKWKHD
jgi:hypothetical protein